MLKQAKAAIAKIVVKKTVAKKEKAVPTVCTNCLASGLRCRVCGTDVV